MRKIRDRFPCIVSNCDGARINAKRQTPARVAGHYSRITWRILEMHATGIRAAKRIADNADFVNVGVIVGVDSGRINPAD